MRYWLVVGVIGFFLGICGCTKRNPSVCCTTDNDCSSVGLPPGSNCGDGLVCINNTCTVDSCHNDSDCISGKPFCGPDGACVECLVSSQCDPADPVCDSSACRGCIRDDECDSAVCDLTTGKCQDASSIVYASPDGTNNGVCGQTVPCDLSTAVTIATSTIQRATVRMLPGTYETKLDVVAGTPIVVVGTGATLTGGSTTFTVKVDGGADVSVRDLTIHVANDFPPVYCNIYPAPTKSALSLTRVTIVPKFGSIQFSILENCRVLLEQVDVSDQIQFDAPTTATIDRSRIVRSDAKPSLTFAGGSDTDATEIVVTNSILSGVSVSQHGPNAVDVSFSTIYGSTGVVQDHVTGDHLMPGVVFKNNIVSANQFSIDCTQCTFTNNVIFPTSVAFPGNILADPLFVGGGNGDFHLGSGSPAVDAADATTTAHDYEGTSRPQGAKADIGAFEQHP